LHIVYCVFKSLYVCVCESEKTLDNEKLVLQSQKT